MDTFTKDCNVDDRGNNTLFTYFTNQSGIRSLEHAYGKYAIDFSQIALGGIYGEYNIALSQVNYKYCNNGEPIDGTPIDRVCETDFAVTKPYLAQKSSFGLTPKATTVNLDGYKDIF